MKNLQTQKVLFAVIISFSTLLFAGCEQPFEPLQENNRYFFSIYGFLDASADTQWVRVMPVTETLYPHPDSLKAAGITIELENIGTEEIITLKDSLFYFGNNLYALNFWTTANIQPDNTYTLTATNADGNSSRASVTIPDEFQTPSVRIAVTDYTGGTNAYFQIK